MDAPVTKRHCAMCLNSIEDKNIILCERCRRRAYCSRKCQIADWYSGEKGQGHKNWCHLLCGEEDIDWKVCDVPDKGLGIVAKRKLPAMYRIIVEWCHSGIGHLPIQDLLPKNGTFDEKFALNCIRRRGNSGCKSLCLRISRANHSCNANADHCYDKMFNVTVLYARRDIEEGEEITINYELFNDISCNVSAEASRLALQNKWGIICPLNCICYCQATQDLITRSRGLDAQILELASKGHIIQAIQIAKELLANHDLLKTSMNNKVRTLYDSFQVAIMKKETLNAAKTFLQEINAIQSAILSPESFAVKEVEILINDMAMHCNYLVCD